MSNIRLGFELVGQNIWEVQADSFFETWLEADGNLVDKSAGLDHYSSRVVILPGKRVAASGRVNRVAPSTVLSTLSHVQARPAWPVHLPSRFSRLHAHLRTDSILDQGVLQNNFGMNLVDGSGKHISFFSLGAPAVQVAWVSRGHFMVVLPASCVKG
ncbi:MAG: hypothetical protein AB1497_11005 [Bacillota bacterium]